MNLVINCAEELSFQENKLKNLLITALIFTLINLTLSATNVIAIFAPHPDDEAISLGGWVTDQSSAGAQIYAIMMTDGEAFSKAVRVNRLSIRPVLAAIDFLKLGKIRRVEGANSLIAIGIPSSHQFFLAYPGNGINRILRAKNPERRIKSPATRQRYGLASWQGEKRQVSYTQKFLIRDVDEILNLLKPDLVVIPAEFDTNSDHFATARLVMARIKANKLKPQIMSYLVHRGSRKKYPKPYGFFPEKGFENPSDLPGPSRFFPSSEAIKRKKRALDCHRTQLRLKDGFLLSFIRKEEIFWKVPLD